ncbi:MAG: dsRBD fold-containing protein [Acidimicrobiia bacterium]
MNKDITIKVHIEEDDSTTTVRPVLDLMGDHFEAQGRARRYPFEEPKPVVGEELALARALNGLQMQVMEAAQDKIARYLSL